ncbi:Protein LURP-one-related 12 [Senna tora]|uniref:Protein LURP-one-related 12 n=1 Tax=Senna tora TaxID=362788 RepID=A0A834T2J5_9FABA|nr:Protein LURP-one-related 12 [Senna tora]
MAKAPSKPGFTQSVNTSFPSITLVHPSIWYSSPPPPPLLSSATSYTSTVTLDRDRPMIDDLFTLKIGLSPSILSPLNPSHRSTDLAAEGEETAAVGIHEDEFVLVAAVGAVGVDAEDELTFAVVDGEAVAGEEEGGLEDEELKMEMEENEA